MTEREKLTGDQEQLIRDYVWKLAFRALVVAGFVNFVAVVAAWNQIQNAAERVATKSAEDTAKEKAEDVAKKTAEATVRDLAQVRQIADDLLVSAIEQTEAVGGLTARNEALGKQLAKLETRAGDLEKALSDEEQKKGVATLLELNKLAAENKDIPAAIAAAANYAAIEQQLAKLASDPVIGHLLAHARIHQQTIDGKPQASLRLPYLEAESISAKGVEAGTVFFRHERKMDGKLWSEPAETH